MKKIALFCFAGAMALLIPFISFSQDAGSKDYREYPHWIEMMQDPEVNYYETVDAFHQYWQDRAERKSVGYNVFKRWEWHMQFKINEDGSKRVNGEDRQAYLEYKAQHPSTREFTGDWMNLGPVQLPSSPNEFWGNGRLNAIAFHPSDPDIFYVGAPSGGLWKTLDGGASWTTLTDGQPTLGVSSVIVDYSNPDVLYLGSGDRDAGDAEGLGVFKSTDGGQSWVQATNGMGNRTVGRMLQDPVDPSTLIAASNGGIYKSTDAGASWDLKQTGNMKELVRKPGSATILYASASGGFYRTADNGETWTQVTSGLPGTAYRGVIAVSDANPEYVYFVASNSQSFIGIYKSTDAGLHFNVQSTSPNILGWSCSGGSGGQAWYDLDMTADPADPETVFVGGINCWKSNNGGQSWYMISNQVGDCGAWPVHADLHVLEWNPVDGRLYAGNDGGIWWTDDGGITWNNITAGLAIGQQYKLGQSKLVSYHTITGYQDNGISTYHGNQWVQTDMYADGMECQMDNTDTTLSYGCMQYGRMFRYINNKVDIAIAGDGINGINEGGAWVTPFTQHEYDPQVMFNGYMNLWRTTNLWDYSPSWTNITLDLAGGGQISIVEHSPADTELFYFGRQNSSMYRSDNIMAETPAFIPLATYLPHSSGLTDIESHPSDPDVVFISQNRKVYRSPDRGLTWEDISGSLPDVNVNDIAFYNRGAHEGLYAGTNIGVFFRDTTMSDWIMFSDGLPAAILVTEIDIFHHPEDPLQDMVRASSYGRGLWESFPYYTFPVADFEASDTATTASCSVTFRDLSTGYPTEWQWTFEGGTPGGATGADPGEIIYSEPGTYYVRLAVTNADGSDTLTRESYITISEAVSPQADFVASDTLVCPDYPVSFHDLSENCPYEWHWEFEPSTVTFVDGTGAASQNPVVEFNEMETYNVTLTATNASGSGVTTKTDYIIIGGASMPFFEDFEAPLMGNMNWYITNPDAGNTWEEFFLEWQDNQAMRMVNWGYFNTEQRDQLISPPINFEGISKAVLRFDHAYAQRFSEIDSLIVYISDDCGISWHRVHQAGPDGTGIFATAPNTGYPFEPTSEEDWCGAGYGADCFAIDLSDWAGSASIRIMFENYNGFGNNLYIDNVHVDIIESTGEPATMVSSTLVYPNPCNGKFSVTTSELRTAAKVTVIDAHGKVVRQDILSPGKDPTLQYDMKQDGQGVYLVRITGNDINEAIKVLVF